jgi:protoheme ferro-lyase
MGKSGRVLTEASNKLPVKLWQGPKLGGSFHVDVSTQLLKASTAIGEPIGFTVQHVETLQHIKVVLLPSKLT